MTGEEWATSTDPEAMLKVARKRASNRKLRLFVCACARELWPCYDHNRSREAVEVAERYADGAAERRELTAACSAAKAVTRQVRWETREQWEDRAGFLYTLRATARDTTHLNMSGAVVAALRNALSVHHLGAGRLLTNPQRIQEVNARTRKTACQRLRDIFGNPFLPLTIAPAIVTPTVASLALAAYEERLLPSGQLDPLRLAVLADALEEAGAEATVLRQVREAKPHVRGWHLLDRLLGRE